MRQAVFVGAFLSLLWSCDVWGQDQRAYFWSNQERVPITIAENLIAVRFKRAPPATLGRLITSVPEITELVDEDRFEPLRAHNVFVYATSTTIKVTHQGLSELQKDLSEMRSEVWNEIADVGQIVVTADGPVAMMTGTLSVGYRHSNPDLDRISVLLDNKRLRVSDLVTVVRRLNANPLVMSYQVKADSELNALEIANAIYEYRDDAGEQIVIYATPALRFARELRSVPNEPFIPDDELFPQQWHLNSTDGLADVDAPEAWDYVRGCNVRIAVFDTGIDTLHPDLIDNVSPGGRDYTTSPYGYDPNPDSGDTHGTRAAGVIAAYGNNEIGVSGICPRCQILPIKIDPFLIERVTRALYDAVNQLGADVITNSWGDRDDETPLTDDIRMALNVVTGTDPVASGVPVFFAVQNQNENWCEGVSPDISALNSVIAVSASSIGDVAGEEAGFGNCVDLVAPTQQGAAGMIITTDPSGAYTTTTNGFGGTSSSVALTAGIAGLLLSLNSELSQRDVRAILQHTAEEISLRPAGSVFVNGFSERAGYGRVNAHRAVVPTVKIQSSDSAVSVGDPFSITVSASAPHLIKEIGWSRRLESCDTVLEEWRDVGELAFHEETWEDLSLDAPGTYTFTANAKDRFYPEADGYPHIASAAFEVLPAVTIVVHGLGSQPDCPDT